MARLFDDAGPQYLNAGSAVVTAPPFSLSAWGYCDDDADPGPDCAVSVTDAGTVDHYHRLDMRMDVAGNPIRAVSVDGATPGEAETSSGATVNTWHHLCGVWAATNDRRVYIDGGSKGTDASTQNVNNATDLYIGAFYNGAILGVTFSGRVAEVAAWSATLTDAEVASLAAGDRKSTRLNSSHKSVSRMPSSA